MSFKECKEIELLNVNIGCSNTTKLRQECFTIFMVAFTGPAITFTKAVC